MTHRKSTYFYTPGPRRGRGYTVLPLSVCPSFRPSKIFFVAFFFSNCWWQKSDIWSQASYRYTILWVAFFDPSDSYFLFADLVGLYTHWTYMHIFRHIFFSNYWWQRSDICHKLHIGTPYHGKRFWTHQIPTSSLPTLLIFIHIEHICSFFVAVFLSNYWWQKSDIWSQASYRYPISWEAFFDPSDSFFLFAEERGIIGEH